MEYEVSRVLTCKLPPHQQDRPGSLSLLCFSYPRSPPKNLLSPTARYILPTDASPVLSLPQQVTPCFLPPIPSAAPRAAHSRAVRETAKNNNNPQKAQLLGWGGLQVGMDKHTSMI